MRVVNDDKDNEWCEFLVFFRPFSFRLISCSCHWRCSRRHTYDWRRKRISLLFSFTSAHLLRLIHTNKRRRQRTSSQHNAVPCIRHAMRGVVNFLNDKQQGTAQEDNDDDVNGRTKQNEMKWEAIDLRIAAARLHHMEKGENKQEKKAPTRWMNRGKIRSGRMIIIIRGEESSSSSKNLVLCRSRGEETSKLSYSLMIYNQEDTRTRTEESLLIYWRKQRSLRLVADWCNWRPPGTDLRGLVSVMSRAEWIQHFRLLFHPFLFLHDFMQCPSTTKSNYLTFKCYNKSHSLLLQFQFICNNQVYKKQQQQQSRRDIQVNFVREWVSK